MKTSEKKHVAETLMEKSTKIKVGRFSFEVKPLTFMQIYEMAAVANDIKKPSWKPGDKINVLQETIIIKVKKTKNTPESVTISSTNTNKDFDNCKEIKVYLWHFCFPFYNLCMFLSQYLSPRDLSVSN